MKTVRFIAYLFYRYYSTGPTKDIPYFSTLCALAMLFGLHLFQFIILFNLTVLLPYSENNRIQNYLVVALYLVPIFSLIYLFVKKSDLEKAHYDENKIRKGNIYLICYIIISIVVLLLLVVFKRGKL
jgi:hypothetical protein